MSRPACAGAARRDLTLVKTSARFPDVEEGIAEWRNARGGVFDVPVAEIVGILDASISEQMAAAPKE